MKPNAAAAAACDSPLPLLRPAATHPLIRYDYIFASTVNTQLYLAASGEGAVSSWSNAALMGTATDQTTLNTACATKCHGTAGCMYWWVTDYAADGTSCYTVSQGTLAESTLSVGFKVAANSYTTWKAPVGAADYLGTKGNSGNDVDVDVPETVTGITTSMACAQECDQHEKCLLYIFDDGTTKTCSLRVGVSDPAVKSSAVKVEFDSAQYVYTA